MFQSRFLSVSLLNSLLISSSISFWASSTYLKKDRLLLVCPLIFLTMYSGMPTQSMLVMQVLRIVWLLSRSQNLHDRLFFFISSRLFPDIRNFAVVHVHPASSPIVFMRSLNLLLMVTGSKRLPGLVLYLLMMSIQ